MRRRNKSGKHYSKEFKEMVVDSVVTGKLRVIDASLKYRVGTSTIHSWLVRAKRKAKAKPNKYIVFPDGSTPQPPPAEPIASTPLPIMEIKINRLESELKDAKQELSHYQWFVQKFLVISQVD